MTVERAKLSPEERRTLYAARRYLGLDLEMKFGLRIPFDIYFQDPLVAARNPALGFDEFCVPWEPGLADGPTSARFAVVDYNADSGTLTPPARWVAKEDAYFGADGQKLDRDAKDSLQFHQVHVWSVVQNALDFFESGFGLGRKITWGFEGSRLIVVPHAGYGENAYYDRNSKSLQFYYFDRPDGRVYTCLSTDIVNHEFGHAVLDGIRPYFIEAILPETAAFHEFVGDLTAILISFRNNRLRHFLGLETKGNLSVDNTLARVAEQFGEAIGGRPYLRTALDPLTMADAARNPQPHHMSKVLTGAVFEIMFRLSQNYIDRGASVREAFAWTIIRIQQMAIQPLDLLPPVDVTFRDYARAMLRAEEIANPTDPGGYRAMMAEVFVKRGILARDECDKLLAAKPVFERLRNIQVFHDIDSIASSRGEAYRFIDDNRDALFIPRNADVTVADLFTAQKLTREGRRLPRQVVLQYVWREDVLLDGAEFGPYAGQVTSLLCGGTLAFDENANVMAWERKPGSLPAGRGKEAATDPKGVERRAAFLAALAQRIRTGRVGEALQTPRGLVAASIPPLAPRMVHGALRFELTPHFGVHDDAHEETGGRRWQISS